MTISFAAFEFGSFLLGMGAGAVIMLGILMLVGAKRKTKR